MTCFLSKARYSRIAGLGLTLVAGMTLAACQSQNELSTSSLASNDFRIRHPIILTEADETLDLPVGSSLRHLSPQMNAVISSFGQESRRKGSGIVEIIAPSRSANETAVHAIMPQIRAALERGGVARRNIVTRTYTVDVDNVAAPVRLAYPAVKAVTTECGLWPDDISGDFANTDYENFGCATQANLAAIVDNPADLIYPAATTPADRQRRAVTFEKYRKGEETASKYKEGLGAKVSDASQN